MYYKENTCDEAAGVTDGQCANLLAAVGDALYAIGGKWTLRVIIALAHGHNRFNELQRTIPGISARVLSSELKGLELNGFVRRLVRAEATPVVVEYSLTEYSNTLAGVVRSLSEWGATHQQKVRE